MITCKKSGPYIKNSLRYCDLKIHGLRDFVVHWPTKIAVTRSIFEIQGSSSGFSPIFIGSKNYVLQPMLYEQFLKFSFF